MKTLTLFCFAGLVGSSTAAHANAFNLNEHDAKVTGRGGTSAASDVDPSSIVFNPGGIAVGEGTSVAVNGSVIAAQGSYTLDGGEKVNTDTSPAIVPAVYLTSRVHDMIAVGIGMHFPFGLAISWPTDHAQSDVIQDQALRTYFITPSVGLNLNKQVPGLSLGFGLDVVPATVELERALVFGDTRGTAHLGGDAFGVGARFGVMYHPPSVKGLKTGIMYRSEVKLAFAGEGDFDIAEPYASQAVPPDGNISTEITLPQSVVGGVAYAPMPELEFEVNAVWIGWSSFQELRIHLPDDSDTVARQNYHDTVTLRLGGEYKLAKQAAALRAGFIYDPTPIPTETLSATLPDIDRKNITVGGSKYFGKYGVHLGLLWVTPGERRTSDTMYMPVYKATYGVQAFVASLMVSGSM